MNRIRRSSNPEIVRSHLEAKKASLDASVAALTDRKYLSPAEELQAKSLKKQKLLMKDALSRL